jgi:hypothetical protein
VETSPVNLLGVCSACQSTAAIGSYECPKCRITDPYRLGDMRQMLGLGPIPGLYAVAFFVTGVTSALSLLIIGYFQWPPQLVYWIGGVVFVGTLIVGVWVHNMEVNTRLQLVGPSLTRQMAELAAANPAVSVGEATSAISAALRIKREPPVVLVAAIATAFAARQDGATAS